MYIIILYTYIIYINVYNMYIRTICPVAARVYSANSHSNPHVFLASSSPGAHSELCRLVLVASVRSEPPNSGFPSFPSEKELIPVDIACFGGLERSGGFRSAFKGFGRNPCQTKLKWRFWRHFKGLGRSRALSYHFLAVSGSGLKVRRAETTEMSSPS